MRLALLVCPFNMFLVGIFLFIEHHTLACAELENTMN